VPDVSEPDPLLLALGIAIREVRTGRRVSQEALALETGVHRNYIGGIERGELNPTLRTIKRLAGAFDLSPSELLARAEALERRSR